jgi:hypothetical protein
MNKTKIVKKLAATVCNASNCDLAKKANCQVDLKVICEGCYKMAHAIINLPELREYYRNEYPKGE